MILGLLGCFGTVPFLNESPKLISVNGEPYVRWNQMELPGLEIDVPLELEIEAEDPEGNTFGVWFPATAGTVEFDPAGRTGRIVPPPGQAVHWLQLVLMDERDPPASEAYSLTFGSSYSTYGTTTADTGN